MAAGKSLPVPCIDLARGYNQGPPAPALLPTSAAPKGGRGLHSHPDAARPKVAGLPAFSRRRTQLGPQDRKPDDAAGFNLNSVNFMPIGLRRRRPPTGPRPHRRPGKAWLGAPAAGASGAVDLVYSPEIPGGQRSRARLARGGRVEF
ncbi:unnamed protein product [Amoebophrya sp. A120]|nr:unnamed protein product [Amoebophrya sp. A120]|eukprot:GSA120T00001254001.1